MQDNGELEEYHREEKWEWEWERQLGGRIKRTPGASCVVVIMAEPMAGVKKRADKLS